MPPKPWPVLQPRPLMPPSSTQMAALWLYSGLAGATDAERFWRELIGQQTGPRFVATEWPGRGWRLTITEAGLAQCGAIVVLVGGAGKAAALREIACGDFAPKAHPGQVLREHAPRVTWLADQEAAAGL